MLLTELILRKMAVDREILLLSELSLTVNVTCTSELAVERDYTAVDVLGRQNVIACMVHMYMNDLVDSTGRTIGVTPVMWHISLI